jgi:DNA gyrase subunit A
VPDEGAQEPQRRVVLQPVEDELRRSYIDYAMSVIVGRALPDVRDGLKPVQRRILYAMNDLGMSSGSQFKKSARVVGEVIGKYHPHGDLAVYDALARMVQDFSLRYPLIDGQGNWGSTEDEPAAMRYTECRLEKTAEAMLEDLEKDTVDWFDNFDGTLKEPLVLPSKFPNLLVNGSSGIAVGMATNMPPHNLGEVADALTVLIDHPEAELRDLFDPQKGPIRGPDFPTGGILYGIEGVAEAYRSGRGLISIRARAKFEETGRDKVRIVITEIPYMVNKASLVESIALLVKSKKIEGVTDLRDESDREGMRIVLELKRDAIEDVVLNQLYHHTQMETTFGVINLALVDGKPRLLPLKEELQCYIDHRIIIVQRRTEFDLRKARERLHIVEGLITAVDHIDEVIRLIRHSQTVDDARGGLMSRYLLSEPQANAILSMTLRQLTGLEIEKLRQEQRDLTGKIEALEAILASRERILQIIKDELAGMKEKFGDERRTSLELHATDMEIEDLIPEETNVVVITNSHYVKRISLGEYRVQDRAGKGLIGIQPKEEDFVVDSFAASTHDYLLCFTTLGKVFWLKTFQIPQTSRYGRGKPIINLLPKLQPEEQISAMIPVRDFSEDNFLVFATRSGTVKRTNLSSYGRPLRTGIIALRLREGDEVVDVLKANSSDEVILVTHRGKGLRFTVQSVRDVGRSSFGVRGIRLRGDDKVAAMVLADDQKSLLTVSVRGYAKRTWMLYDKETSSGFPTRARGGLGVIALRVNSKTGTVVDALSVGPGDQVLASTKRGMVIRCPTEKVSEQGRIASGVRLITLDEGDEVVAVARLTETEGAGQVVGSQTVPINNDPDSPPRSA